MIVKAKWTPTILGFDAKPACGCLHGPIYEAQLYEDIQGGRVRNSIKVLKGCADMNIILYPLFLYPSFYL